VGRLSILHTLFSLTCGLYVDPLSIIYTLFSLTCGLLRGPFTWALPTPNGSSTTTVIKLLRGKGISNIFRLLGHRTLKPRLQFILKIYFLFNSKLNGQKLGFITPLSSSISREGLVSACYMVDRHSGRRQNQFGRQTKFARIFFTCPNITNK